MKRVTRFATAALVGGMILGGFAARASADVVATPSPTDSTTMTDLQVDLEQATVEQHADANDSESGEEMTADQNQMDNVSLEDTQDQPDPTEQPSVQPSDQSSNNDSNGDLMSGEHRNPNSDGHGDGQNVSGDHHGDGPDVSQSETPEPEQSDSVDQASTESPTPEPSDTPDSTNTPTDSQSQVTD
ncbi:MAG: hypothetical protein ACYDCC_06365 [Actinomycetota bacterium]